MALWLGLYHYLGARAWPGRAGHGKCLLVCLRGKCSEPSNSQTREGKTHAFALDGLQGSALHLSPHPGSIQTPQEPWTLAGLLVMVAKFSSLKTRVLSQRRLSRVNAVNGVYALKDRACPSKGKGYMQDVQKIEPERKICRQSLRFGF